jgi:DNA-binding transcriptional ArsR family regulator
MAAHAGMSGIFPIKRSIELDDDRGARLVDIDESVADEVFEALSSGTTRQIFKRLHESPQTASDLAEATETSLQNVQYHLEKLSDVELVEVADTWYSERGTEMKVYAPTDDALVLFAGRDKQGTLKSLLKRVAAVLAVLLPASAIVGLVLGEELVATFLSSAGGGEGGVGVATDSVGYAAETAANGDPTLLVALAFFLGGAFVLSVVAAGRVYRRGT